MREGGILVKIAGAAPEQAARERGVRAELLVTSPTSNRLARITRAGRAGQVSVEIAEVLRLAEVRRAHELSESGPTRGKLILTVGT